MACFQRLLNKTPVLISRCLVVLAKLTQLLLQRQDRPRGSGAPILCRLLLLHSHIVYFACLYFSYVWLALIMVPLLVSFLLNNALQPYRKKWLNVASRFCGLWSSNSSYNPVCLQYYISTSRIPLWIPGSLFSFLFHSHLHGCICSIKLAIPENHGINEGFDDSTL